MLNIREETLHLLKVNYSRAGLQTSASSLDKLLFSIVGFHCFRLGLTSAHPVNDLSIVIQKILAIVGYIFGDSGKEKSCLF